MSLATASRGGIFWRLTARSLTQNRMRTGVSLVGVVLSAALITAVLTTVTSMDHGLFQRAVETEGGWYVWCGSASAQAADILAADERVGAVATSHELGSAYFDLDARERMGVPVLSVIEMPHTLKDENGKAEGLMIGPKIVEGRLPETPDEIVVPLRLKGVTLVAGADLTPSGGERSVAQTWGIVGTSGAASDGPIELGSTLTLDLGTRTFADGSTTYAADDRFYGDVETGKWSEQRMEHVERHAYTVVGFRAPQQDYLGSMLIASQLSVVAVTCEGAASSLDGPATAMSVWASCEGFRDYETFDDAMIDAFYDSTLDGGDPTVRVTRPEFSTHYNLIRYGGLIDDRSVFDTLWAVATVLVSVIVVASVSLIYTSFAISVTERTRQFGLLASAGASAAQLRRMVLAEALALGVVGIPVGIACGIAGVAVVLSFTGEGFSYLLGTTDGIQLSVSPRVIAMVAALSMVVLLLSAWVPARRAGRSSAVDAIRQVHDVRIGRAARREIERAERRHVVPASVGQLPSLFARVAGVPGFVAHRNLSRASSRGRVVAVSLAVSFALFVTSGTISQYLRPFEDLASSTGAQIRGDLLVYIVGGGRESEDDLAEAVSAVSAVVDGDPTMELQGTERMGAIQVRIPASMVAEDVRWALGREDEQVIAAGDADDPSQLNEANFTDGGDYVGYARVTFVDELTWERLASNAGVDAAADDTALALNTYRSSYGGTDAESYTIVDPFSDVGDVSVYELGESGDEFGRWLIASGDEVLVRHEIDNDVSYDGNDSAWRDVPLAEEDPASWILHVAALTKEMSDGLSYYEGTSSFPVLLMPLRVMEAHPALYQGDVTISVSARDSAQAAQDLSDIVKATSGIIDGWVTDISGEAREVRAIMGTISLFVALFSLITMLIAVANVFNTLANSITLRAREFAVLRSVGMGPVAFGRMIVCECASYALRGLMGGACLALVVNLLVWWSFNLSFTGLEMRIPWGHVAAAVAGVLVVLAVSVAYALRKSGATTIVEALRAEVA